MSRASMWADWFVAYWLVQALQSSFVVQEGATPLMDMESAASKTQFSPFPTMYFGNTTRHLTPPDAQRSPLISLFLIKRLSTLSSIVKCEYQPDLRTRIQKARTQMKSL